MTENLKITLVQSDLFWEDRTSNLEMFARKFQNIQEPTDLIILPEMFSTGFSMHAEKLAESPDGETFQWMVLQAQNLNTALTGSFIVKENRNYYNRLFFVFPDGSFKKYDKRHTFTYAKENESYSAGESRLLIDYKGWRICPLICYDLRFPVWSRNTDDYDILIYIANWPEARTVAWNTLLRARAIENMAYCVGVNRVGRDGNDHHYVGHSAIFDALGAQISPSAFDEFIQTVTLDHEKLIAARKRFGFLNDRDSFHLL